MSKRYNQFQNRPQVNKKPKLEISYNNRNISTSTRTNVPPVNTKPIQNDVEALWGEDDDEVIFLASQVAEQVEQCSQQVIADQHILGDITFNKFSREIKTSTQIVRQSDSIFTDFLEDGDDAFDNVGDYFGNQEKNLKDEGKQKESASCGFKVPQIVGKPTFSKANGTASCSSIGKSDTNATIRNDPKDMQVNYLMNRLEAIKKENEQLSKDITEFTDKIQTKEGEVSMLRHELRHIKQVNDNLRLEKMKENETVKKEWQDKIEELEKLLKANQSELEFKNIEISNLKTKKLNETQRVMDTSAFDAKRDYGNLSALHHLHLSLEFSYKLKLTQSIPDEIFTKSPASNFSFRENVFLRYLEELQSVLAQIHSRETLDPFFTNYLSDKVLSTCMASISELKHYIQDLEFPKYRDTNANVEYKFLCQERQELQTCNMHRQNIKSIFHENALFPNEKAIVVRRLVATIALLCKHLKPLWRSLMVEKVGEYTLMQILVEAINIIGYSKEIFSHTGLIESFATILNSSIHNSAENEFILSQYLKNLIFCRPTTRPLVEISRFLCNISSQWTNKFTLNSLCTKSSEEYFFINEYYKIFLFSPESCPLQVYGALLEVALPQYRVLSQQQTEALTVICYNHTRFLRNSIEKLAHWVLASSTESCCDCYAKAVTSFVVLLHLTLNQWICDPKSIDIKRISKISRVGSLVLCDIFHTNYRREVLQSGGSAIKHRLHIIYDWLNEHKSLFRFRAPHLNALNFIKLLHIMADPLKNYEEQNNNEYTVDGNNIWRKIFNDFI